MRCRLSIRCAPRQPEVFIPRYGNCERSVEILKRAASWYRGPSAP